MLPYDAPPLRTRPPTPCHGAGGWRTARHRMSGLTFAWQGHEVVFMACTAAQTVSTSALQRVLLSFLCLLFAGKEACAAYTLRLSPRCAWHYVLT